MLLLLHQTLPLGQTETGDEEPEGEVGGQRPVGQKDIECRITEVDDDPTNPAFKIILLEHPHAHETECRHRGIKHLDVVVDGAELFGNEGLEVFNAEEESGCERQKCDE